MGQGKTIGKDDDEGEGWLKKVAKNGIGSGAGEGKGSLESISSVDSFFYSPGQGKRSQGNLTKKIDEKDD
jgi:hypothetical protein